MPIDGALEGHAFGPEQVKVITTAFDDALRELDTDRSDPLAEVVAKKMMELAQKGESDPVRLRKRTLKELRS
jgi:hypothetical protein